METPTIIETTGTSSPASFKNAFLVGGIALVGIGGLSYYFYVQGKKKNVFVAPPNDTNSAGNPTGGNPSNTDNLRTIAGKIHDDCTGANFLTNHDESPYESALALSNTDFVQLYNEYNALFQSADTETMTQMINDQWSTPLTQWREIKTTIMDRLASLGLK